MTESKPIRGVRSPSKDYSHVPATVAKGPPEELPTVDKPLTEKMLRFVDHWMRHRNAGQAYKAAYDTENCLPTTIRSLGSRLLRTPAIQNEIEARNDVVTRQVGVDAAWLLQRFVDISTADPRELIGLKIGCCRYCHGDGHLYQWREREYLEALDEAERLTAQGVKDARLPDIAGGFDFNATLEPVEGCPQCHGEGIERFVPRDTDKLSDEALLLYGGVKVKKDGYEIIIADRGKALDSVARILGAYTDKVDVTTQNRHLHAIADLRNMDPQEAARGYQQFIQGNMAS